MSDAREISGPIDEIYSEKLKTKVTTEDKRARIVQQHAPMAKKSWESSSSRRSGNTTSMEGMEQELDASWKGGQSLFADQAEMKERVRQALHHEVYNVHDLYWTKGVFQWIARSRSFDIGTLLIISLNAAWIAIEVDNNKATFVIHADPIFVIVENMFCLYFSSEWFVRFMAFQKKKSCLADWPFVFDSALVSFMAFETWVMSLCLLVMFQGIDDTEGLGQTSILRIVRLFRLTRMARVARLLRTVPELMILVKGIFVATRAVFFTLCLLAMIIYVFSITFVQLSEDTLNVKKLYFSSVLHSCSSLLLRGTLPDVSAIVEDLGKEHFMFGVLIMCFILLAYLTIMNMLVGVIVEVVNVVASVEKEAMQVQHVRSQLEMMLATSGLDDDHNGRISRTEFEQLLVKPRAARTIQDVGVDVIALVDFADFIFYQNEEITIGSFMRLVMELRGSNPATVKDVVDLRRFIVQELAAVSYNFEEKLKRRTLSSNDSNGQGFTTGDFDDDDANNNAGTEAADSKRACDCGSLLGGPPIGPNSVGRINSPAVCPFCQLGSSIGQIPGQPSVWSSSVRPAPLNTIPHQKDQPKHSHGDLGLEDFIEHQLEGIRYFLSESNRNSLGFVSDTMCRMRLRFQGSRSDADAGAGGDAAAGGQQPTPPSGPSIDALSPCPPEGSRPPVPLRTTKLSVRPGSLPHSRETSKSTKLAHLPAQQSTIQNDKWALPPPPMLMQPSPPTGTSVSPWSTPAASARSVSAGASRRVACERGRQTRDAARRNPPSLTPEDAGTVGSAHDSDACGGDGNSANGGGRGVAAVEGIHSQVVSGTITIGGSSDAKCRRLHRTSSSVSLS
eukprot:TRINITY_DN2906_c0_g1_i2.p1 TRINITY_DN2906_c0_g1~~TRINITY_DN2906_c0_g1_i2.p1  ORF type:complete len:843 (+),score=124.19 TRINITY_DN2906_c0_g1_i2:135-2663(+)